MCRNTGGGVSLILKNKRESKSAVRELYASKSYTIKAYFRNCFTQDSHRAALY
jgi:hypothetical protein